jgi:hypothetical protein
MIRMKPTRWIMRLFVEIIPLGYQHMFGYTCTINYISNFHWPCASHAEEPVQGAEALCRSYAMNNMTNHNMPLPVYSPSRDTRHQSHMDKKRTSKIFNERQSSYLVEWDLTKIKIESPISLKFYWLCIYVWKCDH